MDLALGSVLALIYRILGMTFVMLVGIVVAHALSDGDRGIYVTLVAVMTAVGSVAGSFASSSGYFVSRQGRPAAEVASNSLLLSVVLGAVTGAALLAAWLFYSGEYRDVVLLVGIGMLPMIARPAIGGVFLGTNAIARYSFSVHGQAALAFAILVVWLYGFDQRSIEAALGALIVSQYLALVALILMGTGWWGWLRTRRPSPDLLRGMIGFGALTGLAGFISFFNYRVDQVIVLGIAGKQEAGIYPSAVFIAEGLWFLSTALAVASYASVGSLGREEAAALTARAVRQTIAAVTVGAIVVFLFAPQMIRLLYPDHHAEAANALRVLCVGTAAFAPQSLISNYYTVQLGRPAIALGLATLSAVVNIGVSTALVPSYGYMGGAWGTTVSYVLVSLLSLALFVRLSGIGIGELVRPRLDDLLVYVRLVQRLRDRAGGAEAVSPGPLP